MVHYGKQVHRLFPVKAKPNRLHLPIYDPVYRPRSRPRWYFPTTSHLHTKTHTHIYIYIYMIDIPVTCSVLTGSGLITRWPPFIAQGTDASGASLMDSSHAVVGAFAFCVGWWIRHLYVTKEEPAPCKCVCNCAFSFPGGDSSGSWGSTGVLIGVIWCLLFCWPTWLWLARSPG